MNHHHDHFPHPQERLSTAEKFEKLLDHWMHHNEEHASAYETWAEKAAVEGISEVPAILRIAAEKTREVNDHFKAALSVLKNRP